MKICNNKNIPIRKCIIVIFILVYTIVISAQSCQVMRQCNKYQDNIYDVKVPEAVIPHNIDAATADSIKLLYQQISRHVEDTANIVRNYQNDANVVIVKVNHFVELWITLSSAFIALVIGLSVWTNYTQEKDFIRKIGDYYGYYIQINKINSIISCLDCLRDPALCNIDRQRFAVRYITLLYEELAKYIEDIKEGINKKIINFGTDHECIYTQLIMSELKTTIVRLQPMFPNIDQNILTNRFTDKITNTIIGLQEGRICKRNLVKNLNEVLVEFGKFKNFIMR